MQNALYAPVDGITRWLHELTSSRKGLEPGREILDLLSQRCTLHLLAALQSGSLRFNALVRRTGASANTVRLRLNAMAEAGIVERTVESQMPPSVRFRLTRRGEELAELVGGLLEWEARWSRADAGPAEMGRAAISLAAEEVKPYRPE